MKNRTLLTSLILIATSIYCIASSWLPFGSGMNHRVQTMATSLNNELFLGGNFTNSDGVSTNHITKWDGTSFTSLGTGLSGYVYDMEFLTNGDLIVGGLGFGGISDPNKYLARWDGTNWTLLENFNGPVNSIVFDQNNNELYVGGSFTFNGSSSFNHIAKWDGTNWTPLSSGVNFEVADMKLDNSGNLYVVGKNNSNIKKWNGSSWTTLASANGIISCIEIDDNGNLFVGGQFTTIDGVNANRVAKFNGTNWLAMGAGLNDSVIELFVDSFNKIYIGGYFNLSGTIPLNNIAVWDGNQFNSLSNGFSHNQTNFSFVDEIFIHDSKLIVGGMFTNSGTQSVNYVAKWKDDIDPCYGLNATASFVFANSTHTTQHNSIYGPIDVHVLCLSDDLFVDGTQSECENSYFVAIAEFDLMTWTDTNPLFSEWISPLTQAPNNIDITSYLPQGYQLRPNIIYKFKLAVGSPWHEESLWFEIDCCKRRKPDKPQNPQEKN